MGLIVQKQLFGSAQNARGEIACERRRSLRGAASCALLYDVGKQFIKLVELLGQASC